MPLQADNVSMEDDDDLTNEIVEQVNEWSSNSNECFTIQLVRSDGSLATSFQPEFTYPMFGNEEAIFGYQDLSITLSLAADTLRPKLDVSYGKIFEAQGDVKPTDIHEALRDFLSDTAFQKEQTQQDTTRFRPPGDKVHQYHRNGMTYGIWCASLADPAAKELLTNMQILVPMFIEGGSILELEQDWTTQRWKIFLLYQIDEKARDKSSPYTLAGFGTSYRIFTFPDRQKLREDNADFCSPTSQSVDAYISSRTPDVPSPLELPSRERLSQFLVFPPNQGAGHGQELYNTMYSYMTEPANVREFTVEDPNEKFDDLRDFCDLLYLRAHSSEFAELRINPDVPSDKLGSSDTIPTDLIVPAAIREKIMQETKIMPRQFDRLVEMHTLSFIPARHRSRSRITRKEKSSDKFDRAYYFWRLYVKQRLYIFNRDSLIQVEQTERVEKLDAALDSVLEAYTEMIEKVEARERDIADGKVESEPANGTTKRKRRVVADDEDEEDEEAGAEQVDVESLTNGQQSKKARH